MHSNYPTNRPCGVGMRSPTESVSCGVAGVRSPAESESCGVSGPAESRTPRLRSPGDLDPSLVGGRYSQVGEVCHLDPAQLHPPSCYSCSYRPFLRFLNPDRCSLPLACPCDPRLTACGGGDQSCRRGVSGYQGVNSTLRSAVTADVTVPCLLETTTRCVIEHCLG